MSYKLISVYILRKQTAACVKSLIDETNWNRYAAENDL